MREDKWLQISLSSLKPAFTEFTSRGGVLRILRPDEERSRATGLVFLCPHCKSNKEKQHYLIFLFDDPRVPELARPHGRFTPSRDALVSKAPMDFSRLTLTQLTSERILDYDVEHTVNLKPQDVCGWQGSLIDGMVRFKKKPKTFTEWVRGNHW
jgi:hypothetical protein